MQSERDLQALVGREFPGGRYLIQPFEDWLLRDAISAPPGERESAHPLYAFIATLGGTGLSIDDLLHTCGSSADEGPMHGECTLDLVEPLRSGVEYAVAGRITDVRRKAGRAVGAFDLVTFLLEMRTPDGAVAARCMNTLVLPRRDARAG
jgi:hypothetical protein